MEIFKKDVYSRFSNFQVFPGWPRRLLKQTPESPLRREDTNAGVSGYLIISEQNRNISSRSPEIHRESAMEKVIFSKLAVLLNLNLAGVCCSLI